MKTQNPTLLASLYNPNTTVCTLWRLARADGTVMGFTDHDRDLVVGGVTYGAAAGYVPSAMQFSADLAPGNLEVKGVLNSSFITAADIIAGKYDNCGLTISLYDWQNAIGPQTLQRGWLGNITRNASSFTAEIRGLKDILDKTQMIDWYQIACDADFCDLHGENRCTLDPAGFTAAGTVTSVTSNSVFAASVSLPAGTNITTSMSFSFGMVAWTSGLNEGVANEIKSWTPGSPGYFTDPGSFDLWLGAGEAIAPGDHFNALIGCDKSFATCKNSFGNGVNHRGYPDIPGLDAAMQTPSVT